MSLDVVQAHPYVVNLLALAEAAEGELDAAAEQLQVVDQSALGDVQRLLYLLVARTVELRRDNVPIAIAARELRQLLRAHPSAIRHELVVRLALHACCRSLALAQGCRLRAIYYRVRLWLP